MKAYQLWMVARDPATLQELARALLQESDARENCEIYNEALTVADKVNLARSYFGRALHARKPLYVVPTLPNPRAGFVSSPPVPVGEMKPWTSGAVVVHHFPAPKRTVPEEAPWIEGEVVPASHGAPARPCDCANPDTSVVGVCPACHGWLNGGRPPAPSPQLCQCGPQQYVMVSACRCGRCGRAIK